MLRKLSILMAVSALLGVATAAEAQVVLTPIGQSGLPGDTVDLHIATSGPSAPEVTVANVMVAYDPSGSSWDPVADPSTGEVDCAAAPDLAGHVQPAPVRAQPNRSRIVMGFGDLEVPLTPFGRAGIILSCRITIRPDAVPGTYPLLCVGAPSASDQYGNEIAASCVSGALTVEGAGEARAGAPVGRQMAPGGGPAPAPVIGEAVVAGGAAAGAVAGGQAPAAGAGVAAPKAAPPGAAVREAAAPQAPAPGAGETGTAPAGLPQGPAGVATALQPAPATPKGSPAAPAAAATAAAPTPVAAATRAAAVKSPVPAATAAKAQQAAPQPTAKESGCAISPQNESGWGWVPAVPLIALLLLRRRRR